MVELLAPVGDFETQKSLQNMENILFYKYVTLDPKKEQEELLDLTKRYELLGTILLSCEGINGCLSGTKANTDKFIKEMTKKNYFADIAFKKTPAQSHTFEKLLVKIKPEIIRLANPQTCISNAGSYVTPKELKKMLDEKQDIILVDMRNEYEAKIGTFANAFVMPVQSFREIPQTLSILEPYKHRKIITFCTGGIRCEKASALLKEHGFTDVSQLHGGIIQYGLDCGNAHWEGKCFVFDNRLAIDLDPQNPSEPISVRLKEMLSYALEHDEYNFLKKATGSYKDIVIRANDSELLLLFEKACEFVSNNALARKVKHHCGVCSM